MLKKNSEEGGLFSANQQLNSKTEFQFLLYKHPENIFRPKYKTVYHISKICKQNYTTKLIPLNTVTY